MLFAYDSGSQRFGLNWLGSSSGLSWSPSGGCSHLGLEGSGWPHSHDWQVVLAPGWASLSTWSLAVKEDGLGVFTQGSQDSKKA